MELLECLGNCGSGIHGSEFAESERSREQSVLYRLTIWKHLMEQIRSDTGTTSSILINRNDDYSHDLSSIFSKKALLQASPDSFLIVKIF
jgi:hypothetical protein